MRCWNCSNTYRTHGCRITLYYIARYLSVFLLIGLCITSGLYAVGNLVTIQAQNFTCAQYSEEQVRKINFEEGYEHGQSNSCYYIDRQKLNFEAIYNLDIDIYTAFFANNVGPLDVILCILYSIIFLVSMILTLYHGYYLLYDSYYTIIACCNCYADGVNPRFQKIVEKYIRNQNHKTKIKQNRKNEERKNRCSKCQPYFISLLKCVKNGWSSYIRFMSNNCYIESRNWILGIIVREFIEILIQVYALLLYGGTNLLNLNENVLAQEGHIVEGVNCMHALVGGTKMIFF